MSLEFLIERNNVAFRVNHNYNAIRWNRSKCHDDSLLLQLVDGILDPALVDLVVGEVDDPQGTYLAAGGQQSRDCLVRE